MLCGTRTGAYQYHAVLATGQDIWLGLHSKSDWDVLNVARGSLGSGYDYRYGKPGVFFGLSMPFVADDVLLAPSHLNYLLYNLNRRIPASLVDQNFGQPVKIFNDSGDAVGSIDFWPLRGVQRINARLLYHHKTRYTAFRLSLLPSALS
jgi:hypothetical protein